MHARFALVPIAAVIAFVLIAGIAHGQSTGSLDITIPSSYPLGSVMAYGSSGPVEVHGGIGIVQYGDGVFVSIPTNASDGDRLSFFQDTGTWALFRNNTLVLPIHGAGGAAANLILATGDLVASSGRFYGLVTGLELDTGALDAGGSSASAVLYLDKLPDGAAYRFAILENDSIKKAVLAEASPGGAPDAVILMAEVSGVSPDAQSSIGYAIVRMMPDDALQGGNVTAYRYDGGAVSRLPGKAVESRNGTFYEAISPGPGTFAFVGPSREPPPARADLQSTLAFTGALALSLALLVGLIIKGLRWSTKKE